MFNMIYTHTKQNANTELFSKFSSPENEAVITTIKNLMIEQGQQGKLLNYSTVTSGDGLMFVSTMSWATENDYNAFLAANAGILGQYEDARNVYNSANNITLVKSSETV